MHIISEEHQFMMLNIERIDCEILRLNMKITAELLSHNCTCLLKIILVVDGNNISQELVSQSNDTLD